MKNNDKTQDYASNKTFQAVRYLLSIKESSKSHANNMRDAQYSDKTRNIAVTIGKIWKIWKVLITFSCSSLDVDDLYNFNLEQKSNFIRKEPKPVTLHLAKFALRKKQFATRLEAKWENNAMIDY